jgi:hypothetical protein
MLQELTMIRHPEVRAIGAFTRVFEARKSAHLRMTG